MCQKPILTSAPGMARSYRADSLDIRSRPGGSRSIRRSRLAPNLGLLARLTLWTAAGLLVSGCSQLESEGLGGHRASTADRTPNDSPVDEDFGMSIGAEMPTWMLDFRSALSRPRNIAHGRLIFKRTCRNCHRLDEDGYNVGPSLCHVFRKTDTEILQDILEPNRNIHPDFRMCHVVTKNGFISTGILHAESEQSLTLRRENGLREIILRDNIERVTLSNVSLMPTNIQEQLNPQDVADLIAYLRQTTTPKQESTTVAYP